MPDISKFRYAFDGRNITTVGYDERVAVVSPVVMQSHGRLMAASGDLYSAAKMLMEASVNIRADAFPSERMARAFEAMSLAIAKAEGR